MSLPYAFIVSSITENQEKEAISARVSLLRVQCQRVMPSAHVKHIKKRKKEKVALPLRLFADTQCFKCLCVRRQCFIIFPLSLSKYSFHRC